MIIKTKTKDKYEIICKLYKGKFKYTLYCNEKEIFNFISDRKPNELTMKNLDMKRLIEQIRVKDLSNLKEIQLLMFHNIKDNLEITLDDGDADYGNYQQLDNVIYNSNGVEIFNFGLVNVGLLEDDKYIIAIKSFNDVLTYTGKISEISEVLVDEGYINTSIGNYKFILRNIIRYFCSKNVNKNRGERGVCVCK